MTEQHDLDELVPAGIDDSVEHGLRQLFAVARAPGTADELAAEAAVVASMSDIVRRQAAIGDVTQRRTPLRRVAGSRTAKVAMITGFVVVVTSAAVAAGVVPQPVQSVFDRAARIASWQNAERDEPDAAVRKDPEPRTTTVAIEASDAIAPTTVAAYITVDRESDALALCGMWATSIRSGVELEADAKLALAAMTAQTGAALERLCGSAASRPDEPPVEFVPAAQETPPPEAVLPPTVSTVDTTVPTTDAPPAATDDGTPKATPTLPPQANGDGPPVTEPVPVDTGNDAGTVGTPNANANPNANGGANADGGNPNANPHAGSANPNSDADANANGNTNPDANGGGPNGNANGGNQNSHGGNGNG